LTKYEGGVSKTPKLTRNLHDLKEIEKRIKDLLTGKTKVISEKEARKHLKWNKKKKDI